MEGSEANGSNGSCGPNGSTSPAPLDYSDGPETSNGSKGPETPVFNEGAGSYWTGVSLGPAELEPRWGRRHGGINKGLSVWSTESVRLQEPLGSPDGPETPVANEGAGSYWT